MHSGVRTAVSVAMMVGTSALVAVSAAPAAVAVETIAARPGATAVVLAPQKPDKPKKPKPVKPKPDNPDAPAEPTPDTTAPAKPQVGTPVVGAEGAIGVTVRAEKGSQVVIREQGGPVVAQGKAVGGSVTLRWTTTTGSHDYAVRATDKAGNRSPKATFTAVADATAPRVRQFQVQPGTPQDTRSVVTFRTQRDAAYRVLLDGAVVAEGTAEERDVRRRLDVADGRYDLTVEVRDEVGNLGSATKVLRVRIPELAVTSEVTSEPTAPVQTVRVAAPPTAVRGQLRVPGLDPQPFRLKGGEATVRVRLTDGTYDAIRVTVRDTQGRVGRVVLPPVQVDTTPPVLEVRPDPEAAADGKLRAEVVSEDGAEIAWRLLTSAGVVAASGSFVAEDGGGTIAQDVEEGRYQLQVEATDTFARTTSQEAGTSIAADPWPTWLVVLVSVGTIVGGLVLLALLALLLRRAWRWARPGVLARRDRWRRRRTARARLAAENAARRSEEREAQRAQKEQARAERDQERAHRAAAAAETAVPERTETLTTFLGAVEAGVDAEVVGLALGEDEVVRHLTAATLYEAVGEADELEGHDGELVLTNHRILFLGDPQREWLVDRVADLRDIGDDQTMVRLAGQDTWAGLVYADPETTRLHLDLLRAEQQGRGAEHLSALQ